MNKESLLNILFNVNYAKSTTYQNIINSQNGIQIRVVLAFLPSKVILNQGEMEDLL